MPSAPAKNKPRRLIAASATPAEEPMTSVTAELPVRVVGVIDGIAKDEDRSRSSVIRRIISAWDESRAK